jgi:hypothetical protein
MTERRTGDPANTGVAKDKAAGGGESGGGAYPNPHSGKAPDRGGYMGHGGQSDMAYHGTGQLGGKVARGRHSPNAPARDTGEEEE